ncbi:spore coat protein [Mesobacillus subterraneus]|uniref:Spore coat protein n=1 Tax=Mesobacillus subterraneus TaxID=285983 RepID=A0A0D6ZFC6_9BACI|nr:spore coat protein [Mesobacillus subterraneus]KIY23776.1 spore coat protein [Mesobacillus subterraneus]
MQLSTHELYQLNELTMSCVNSLTNMAYMLHHVQDPEFKMILERHYPMHVRDYNMKVEFLNKLEVPTKTIPMLKNIVHNNAIATNNVKTLPIQPRTEMENMNDREMATAYLLTLKRAGREYAWSAMEMVHPDIRAFCQTAFIMSSSHAYDVWQYMVERGYYPVRQASSEQITEIGAMYEIVPEDSDQVQAFFAQEHNPEVENNTFLS